MPGILVHGDNHFIVRGPLPDPRAANELVRHWSLIQIGATTPPPLDQWQIISREFRENLEWAVVVPGHGAISPAVKNELKHDRASSTRSLGSPMAGLRAASRALNNGVPKIEERRIPAISTSKPRHSDDRW